MPLESAAIAQNEPGDPMPSRLRFPLALALALCCACASAAQDDVQLLVQQATAAYQSACVACHGAGIAGAPKVGDKAAWGPRLAQGKATLYKHAIEGFNGKTGVMPPKGGQAAWPDDLIKQTVDHMVEMTQ